MRLWIDNESARYGLIGGYSSNPFAARIISEIWVQLARHDIAFFVDRVPSTENISDGPSRREWKLIAHLRIARVEATAAVDEATALLSQTFALLFGSAKTSLAKVISLGE